MPSPTQKPLSVRLLVSDITPYPMRKPFERQRQSSSV